MVYKGRGKLFNKGQEMRKRKITTFSLLPEIIEKLRRLASASDMPMSRYIEKVISRQKEIEK